MTGDRFFSYKCGTKCLYGKATALVLLLCPIKQCLSETWSVGHTVTLNVFYGTAGGCLALSWATLHFLYIYQLLLYKKEKLLQEKLTLDNDHDSVQSLSREK